MPTSNPAASSSPQPALTCGIAPLPATRIISGAAINPATNAARHARSPPRAVSSPPDDAADPRDTPVERDEPRGGKSDQHTTGKR